MESWRLGLRRVVKVRGRTRGRIGVWVQGLGGVYE